MAKPYVRPFFTEPPPTRCSSRRFCTPSVSSATSPYRTSMDSAAEGPWQAALLVDLGLLALFALQHSIMARPAFKRVLTRFVLARHRAKHLRAREQPRADRAVLASGSRSAAYVWQVANAVGVALLYAGFAFGWCLVLVTTFVINHFDLFGLRQVWRNLRGAAAARAQVRDARGSTRIVRHPLYVGWFFAFWCTPTMTATHLLFAVMTTGVHPDRDPTRGARPHARAPRVRGLSLEGADADPVPAPPRALHRTGMRPVAHSERFLLQGVPAARTAPSGNAASTSL